jgi:PST family polysaccharide transporter
MFVLTIARVFSIGGYLILLFSFVKNAQQYVLIPLFQSVLIGILAVISFFIMWKLEKVIPARPTIKYMKKIFKECLPFFLSRFSVLINNSLATLVVGLTLGNYSVAVYNLSQRLSHAALIPVTMLNQAIYPHNVKNKNLKFALYSFGGVLAISILGLIFLYFFTPYLIMYLGHNQLNEAIALLRFSEIHVLLCVFTYYLGTPMLVAWGYSKPFNDSVLYSTVCLLLIYGLFYVFSVNNVYLFVLATIFAETIILGYRIFYCVKYKLIRLS